ncbi:MAG: hypothetical protein II889_12135, partial [Clostridia bacterium]|nr:hypothetical protein [Clostridia bacterium]
MKKLLGILLSLLMLASCAASPTETEDSTPPVQGDNPSALETEAPETEIRDNVPEMDFGQDMDLLMSNISWATTNIVGDEITGDLIGDAQYNMKISMEERF